MTAEVATHREIDRWLGVARTASLPIPLLEEDTAWLRLHAPASSVGIVHGDPGPGNLL